MKKTNHTLGKTRVVVTPVLTAYLTDLNNFAVIAQNRGAFFKKRAVQQIHTSNRKPSHKFSPQTTGSKKRSFNSVSGLFRPVATIINLFPRGGKEFRANARFPFRNDRVSTRLTTITKHAS